MQSREGSIYRDPGVRNRIVVMLCVLVFANAAAWIAAVTERAAYAHFLALAWLAYGFGLRHAVDADHICAIDNTTRKLMQDGKRPVGVGFYFSLGHSTVVLLLCALAAVAAGYARAHIPGWQALGDKVGTGISTAFLYLIGGINLAVFISLMKSLRTKRAGQEAWRTDDLLGQLGLMGRIFRPIFRTIRSSWQMYFVGFLFGLGFDTATEVGLLSLAAQQSAAGLTLGALMLLPILFTMGMCLIDSINGVLMLGAYGWAFLNPGRKLVYNVVIVLTSISVAFAVATRQLLQMLGTDLTFKGRLGDLLNDNLGFIIVGVFLVGWLVSVAVYRVRTPLRYGGQES
ncbi:MAG: HoxN/HupN/NixA family nickel/cobalt transporter [Capsulimonadaceae bacterium]|nr:HoxN/HupN/NixA family nickel/cobalt transporter [Capsulimonadaceae bacterium]